jgi:hypothetical protein
MDHVYVAYRQEEQDDRSHTYEVIGVYKWKKDAEAAVKDDREGSHVVETLLQEHYRKYKLFTVHLNIITGDMTISEPEETLTPVKQFPDILGYTSSAAVNLTAALVERLEVKIAASRSLNAMQEVHHWWLQTFKDKIQLRKERGKYIIESSTVTVNTPPMPAATSA